MGVARLRYLAWQAGHSAVGGGLRDRHHDVIQALVQRLGGDRGEVTCCYPLVVMITPTSPTCDNSHVTLLR